MILDKLKRLGHRLNYMCNYNKKTQVIGLLQEALNFKLVETVRLRFSLSDKNLFLVSIRQEGVPGEPFNPFAKPQIIQMIEDHVRGSQLFKGRIINYCNIFST